MADIKNISNENTVSNKYHTDILIFNNDETLMYVLSSEDYYNDNYKKQINGEWSFEFNADISLSKYFTRKNKIGLFDREGNFQLFSIEDIVDIYSLTPSLNVFFVFMIV